jgi:thioredoxin 1
MMSRMISKNDFKMKVLDSVNLSLVQFTIEWSGACQIIWPIYEELASSYSGKANFFTVDVEKETGLDHEYGVQELPTILFFCNGKIIDHIKGLMPKNVIIEKIEKALLNRLN